MVTCPHWVSFCHRPGRDGCHLVIIKRNHLQWFLLLFFNRQNHRLWGSVSQDLLIGIGPKYSYSKVGLKYYKQWCGHFSVTSLFVREKTARSFSFLVRYYYYYYCSPCVKTLLASSCTVTWQIVFKVSHWMWSIEISTKFVFGTFQINDLDLRSHSRSQFRDFETPITQSIFDGFLPNLF